ncbi:thioredoxin family protein [Candidatus Berkelbacteria bacterium CG08_land_8_20_14_0_20_39_8]|uniref:Thioredoxin family protein n=1 Tax=Candidatus Berkelbacteria bacterium CG08_land_8_20_14_0_20_39_8 TaxID=1974511 RepID=A0A2M6YBX5_9BACT|nr:MAG: thioredoxin family protein [Candidatus Berkelbacteria bacterium CG08_land_8_20_14_0_20_39_8]
MKIEVFGSGCSTCKKLFELTKKAVTELNLNVDVIYLTNIQKMLELGILSSPVLAINGKPVITGFPPSIKKIKEVIKENL